MILQLRKYVWATALGIALLIALLLLSSLGFNRELPAKRQVVLQNVKIYEQAKPPLPPEQIKPTRGGSNGLDLQVKIPQREMQLSLMQLDLRAAAVSMPDGYGGTGGLGRGEGSGIGDGLGDGGLDQLFAFNQLDSMPQVMGAPQLLYPDRLRRRGILQFRVLFHIQVDEEGRVHPVRVMEGPDDTLNEQFMNYAAHVVFTPPVREGKRVKAQYSWPVVFYYKEGR